MTNENKGLTEQKLTLEILQTLMDRYADRLFLFVYSIVRRHEVAEELVSDVFVKLWSRRNSFANIRNVESYLYISARNQSISWVRSANRLPVVRIGELTDYSLIPLENDESETFSQEMIDRINETIEALPAKCKMAFCLAKINGLKYKDIGEIMQISPNTVKNHVAYALEKICGRVGISSAKTSIIRHNILFSLYLSLKRLLNKSWKQLSSR